MMKKKTVKKKSRTSRTFAKLRAKLKRKPAVRAQKKRSPKKRKLTSLRSLRSMKSMVNHYLRPLQKAKIPWISGFLASAFLVSVGLWKITSTPQPPSPEILHAEQSFVPSQDTQQRQEQPVAKTQPAAIADPIAAKFSQTRDLTVSERIAFWSDYLLQSTNLKNAAVAFGEAPANGDSAPFLAEKYDCTTYVETVAALARSKSPQDFYGNLIAIRYKDGNPSYLNRNHFPEADWIPNNIKAGIVKDVTEAVASQAGIGAKLASKEINRGEWLAQQVKEQKVSRSIASVVDSSWSTPVQVQVSYIPIEDFNKALDHLPNGAVLNFVRSDNSKHSVLISHQGFIVRMGKQAYLRHVSVGGNIRTVLLSDYVSRPANRGPASWPLVGINLNELTDSR